MRKDEVLQLSRPASGTGFTCLLTEISPSSRLTEGIDRMTKFFQRVFPMMSTWNHSPREPSAMVCYEFVSSRIFPQSLTSSHIRIFELNFLPNSVPYIHFKNTHFEEAQCSSSY